MSYNIQADLGDRICVHLLLRRKQMKISPNWHDVLSQQLTDGDTENKSYELVQLEQKDFAAFPRIFHETCKPTKERMEEFRKLVDEIKQKYEKKEFNSPLYALECLFRHMTHRRRRVTQREIDQMKVDLFSDVYILNNFCNEIAANNLSLKIYKASNDEYYEMLEGIDKEDLNIFLKHPDVKSRHCYF